jgi:hypothetical protein
MPKKSTTIYEIMKEPDFVQEPTRYRFEGIHNSNGACFVQVEKRNAKWTPRSMPIEVPRSVYEAIQKQYWINGTSLIELMKPHTTEAAKN